MKTFKVLSIDSESDKECKMLEELLNEGWKIEHMQTAGAGWILGTDYTTVCVLYRES